MSVDIEPQLSSYGENVFDNVLPNLFHDHKGDTKPFVITPKPPPPQPMTRPPDETEKVDEDEVTEENTLVHPFATTPVRRFDWIRTRWQQKSFRRAAGAAVLLATILVGGGIALFEANRQTITVPVYMLSANNCFTANQGTIARGTDYTINTLEIVAPKGGAVITKFTRRANVCTKAPIYIQNTGNDTGLMNQVADMDQKALSQAGCPDAIACHPVEQLTY